MSQKEGVTETIGENQYIMYMLPPLVSHDLLMDVTKMIGPALAALVGGIFGGKTPENAEEILEKEVNSDFLTTALERLFQDINKATLTKVIQHLRPMTHVDGKPLDQIFDIHFQGELDGMYKWLFWGMRVQWGKSLSALMSGASGQGAGRALANLFPSPTISTGSSGDQ